VQQVGTPSDIYDHPANTFVASFIGSPAMNLLTGTIENGIFKSALTCINGLPKHFKGNVTLGFRAEDAALAPSAGEITAPVYTMELLGESSLVTVQAGGTLVSVKAPKSFRAGIGSTVHASVPAAICHLFDSETSKRIPLQEKEQP
jgi:multiple sugar transport system ATP-binding protein